MIFLATPTSPANLDVESPVRIPFSFSNEDFVNEEFCSFAQPTPINPTLDNEGEQALQSTLTPYPEYTEEKLLDLTMIPDSQEVGQYSLLDLVPPESTMKEAVPVLIDRVNRPPATIVNAFEEVNEIVKEDVVEKGVALDRLEDELMLEIDDSLTQPLPSILDYYRNLSQLHLHLSNANSMQPTQPVQQLSGVCIDSDDEDLKLLRSSVMNDSESSIPVICNTSLGKSISFVAFNSSDLQSTRNTQSVLSLNSIVCPQLEIIPIVPEDDIGSVCSSLDLSIVYPQDLPSKPLDLKRKYISSSEEDDSGDEDYMPTQAPELPSSPLAVNIKKTKEKTPKKPPKSDIFKGLTFLLSISRASTIQILPPLLTNKNMLSSFLRAHQASITSVCTDSCILLSTSPLRTKKYLSALSLGLEIVSVRWVLECLEVGELVDRRAWWMGSGVSALSGVDCCYTPFNPRRVFEGLMFRVEGADTANWEQILSEAGASLSTEYDADYVVISDDSYYHNLTSITTPTKSNICQNTTFFSIGKAIKNDKEKGVKVTTEFIVMCLRHQTILRPESHHSFSPPTL